MRLKIKLNLFLKVLIAIALGAILGMLLPECAIRIFKTANVLFAQLLKFIVPLLVLGLVTPSIANLGKGAERMLVMVVGLSYIFTISAGFFTYGCVTNIYPYYLNVGELSPISGTIEFLPYIELKIPPICDILTALVLSFMLGIGLIFTNGTILKKGFEEFGSIVKLTIEKAIIPALPFYIFTMICEMSAKGVITSIMGNVSLI